MSRRDTSPYSKLEHDGVELLLLPQLAEHTTNLNLDLKKFLFFRFLKAEVELDNGMVLGRRTSWA